MRVVKTLCVLLAMPALLGADEALAQAPIRIGFLAPLTGATAQAGKDLHSGCELYWEQTGWQVAGRKLEVIVDDTEGVPATALNKLRRQVEGDRVHLVAGVVL